MELPSFLNVTPPQPSNPSTEQPSSAHRWVPPSRARAVPSGKTSESALVKERILAQFEAVFPLLMDKVYEGYTLSKAVSELPLGYNIDYGSFNRWVMKDAKRRAVYEEAKEFRTEVWADRMVHHAEVGTDANGDSVTLERSKFAFDTYKFLMGKHNRKGYGDTKTLEVEHRISITAALEQSRQRVIEATVVDVLDGDDEDEIRALVSGDSEDDEDE